ncbi:hypothetical protein BESB_060130 [Besnoitia besnoiti]|uniref:Uncharacterized protein n=1 Tax=Besnoitia besnoiti TaxID=94643 RepID=A0A2A9MGM7_BESBE|nr:hypothetical protein BESB_060130 [Besnoitia besnoiti]PFH35126.1 hypothetical protein BESB_060130 [Besnoitia besnoiti]
MPGISVGAQISLGRDRRKENREGEEAAEGPCVSSSRELIDGGQTSILHDFVFSASSPRQPQAGNRENDAPERAGAERVPPSPFSSPVLPDTCHPAGSHAPSLQYALSASHRRADSPEGEAGAAGSCRKVRGGQIGAIREIRGAPLSAAAWSEAGGRDTVWNRSPNIVQDAQVTAGKRPLRSTVSGSPTSNPDDATLSDRFRSEERTISDDVKKDEWKTHDGTRATTHQAGSSPSSPGSSFASCSVWSDFSEETGVGDALQAQGEGKERKEQPARDTGESASVDSPGRSAASSGRSESESALRRYDGQRRGDVHAAADLPPQVASLQPITAVAPLEPPPVPGLSGASRASVSVQPLETHDSESWPVPPQSQTTAFETFVHSDTTLTQCSFVSSAQAVSAVTVWPPSPSNEGGGQTCAETDAGEREVGASRLTALTSRVSRDRLASVSSEASSCRPASFSPSSESPVCSSPTASSQGRGAEGIGGVAAKSARAEAEKRRLQRQKETRAMLLNSLRFTMSLRGDNGYEWGGSCPSRDTLHPASGARASSRLAQDDRGLPPAPGAAATAAGESPTLSSRTCGPGRASGRDDGGRAGGAAGSREGAGAAASTGGGPQQRGMPVPRSPVVASRRLPSVRVVLETILKAKQASHLGPGNSGAPSARGGGSNAWGDGGPLWGLPPNHGFASSGASTAGEGMGRAPESGQGRSEVAGASGGAWPGAGLGPDPRHPFTASENESWWEGQADLSRWFHGFGDEGVGSVSTPSFRKKAAAAPSWQAGLCYSTRQYESLDVRNLSFYGKMTALFEAHWATIHPLECLVRTAPDEEFPLVSRRAAKRRGGSEAAGDLTPFHPSDEGWIGTGAGEEEGNRQKETRVHPAQAGRGEKSKNDGKNEHELVPFVSLSYLIPCFMLRAFRRLTINKTLLKEMMAEFQLSARRTGDLRRASLGDVAAPLTEKGTSFQSLPSRRGATGVSYPGDTRVAETAARGSSYCKHDPVSQGATNATGRAAAAAQEPKVTKFGESSSSAAPASEVERSVGRPAVGPPAPFASPFLPQAPRADESRHGGSGPLCPPPPSLVVPSLPGSPSNRLPNPLNLRLRGGRLFAASLESQQHSASHLHSLHSPGGVPHSPSSPQLNPPVPAPQLSSASSPSRALPVPSAPYQVLHLYLCCGGKDMLALDWLPFISRFLHYSLSVKVKNLHSRAADAAAAAAAVAAAFSAQAATVDRDTALAGAAAAAAAAATAAEEELNRSSSGTDGEEERAADRPGHAGGEGGARLEGWGDSEAPAAQGEGGAGGASSGGLQGGGAAESAAKQPSQAGRLGPERAPKEMMSTETRRDEKTGSARFPEKRRRHSVFAPAAAAAAAAERKWRRSIVAEVNEFEERSGENAVEIVRRTSRDGAHRQRRLSGGRATSMSLLEKGDFMRRGGGEQDGGRYVTAWTGFRRASQCTPEEFAGLAAAAMRSLQKKEEETQIQNRILEGQLYYVSSSSSARHPVPACKEKDEHAVRLPQAPALARPVSAASSVAPQHAPRFAGKEAEEPRNSRNSSDSSLGDFPEFSVEPSAQASDDESGERRTPTPKTQRADAEQAQPSSRGPVIPAAAANRIDVSSFASSPTSTPPLSSSGDCHPPPSPPSAPRSSSPPSPYVTSGSFVPPARSGSTSLPWWTVKEVEVPILVYMNAAFVLIDYPGYGGSTGSPTPAGCVAAALRSLNVAIHHLKKQRGEDVRIQISVLGYSLGCAVALRAAQVVCRQLLQRKEAQSKKQRREKRVERRRSKRDSDTKPTGDPTHEGRGDEVPRAGAERGGAAAQPQGNQAEHTGETRKENADRRKRLDGVAEEGANQVLICSPFFAPHRSAERERAGYCITQQRAPVDVEVSEGEYASQQTADRTSSSSRVCPRTQDPAQESVPRVPSFASEPASSPASCRLSSSTSSASPVPTCLSDASAEEAAGSVGKSPPGWDQSSKSYVENAECGTTKENSQPRPPVPPSSALFAASSSRGLRNALNLHRSRATSTEEKGDAADRSAGEATDKRRETGKTRGSFSHLQQLLLRRRSRKEKGNDTEKRRDTRAEEKDEGELAESSHREEAMVCRGGGLDGSLPSSVPSVPPDSPSSVASPLSPSPSSPRSFRVVCSEQAVGGPRTAAEDFGGPEKASERALRRNLLDVGMEVGARGDSHRAEGLHLASPFSDSDQDGTRSPSEGPRPTSGFRSAASSVTSRRRSFGGGSRDESVGAPEGRQEAAKGEEARRETVQRRTQPHDDAVGSQASHEQTSPGHQGLCSTGLDEGTAGKLQTRTAGPEDLPLWGIEAAQSRRDAWGSAAERFGSPLQQKLGSFPASPFSETITLHTLFPSASSPPPGSSGRRQHLTRTLSMPSVAGHLKPIASFKELLGPANDSRRVRRQVVTASAPSASAECSLAPLSSSRSISVAVSPACDPFSSSVRCPASPPHVAASPSPSSAARPASGHSLPSQEAPELFHAVLEHAVESHTRAVDSDSESPSRRYGHRPGPREGHATTALRGVSGVLTESPAEPPPVSSRMHVKEAERESGKREVREQMPFVSEPKSFLSSRSRLEACASSARSSGKTGPSSRGSSPCKWSGLSSSLASASSPFGQGSPFPSSSSLQYGDDEDTAPSSTSCSLATSAFDSCSSASSEEEDEADSDDDEFSSELDEAYCLPTEFAEFRRLVLVAPFTSTADCAAHYLNLPWGVRGMVEAFISYIQDECTRWDNVACMRSLCRVFDANPKLFAGVGLYIFHGREDRIVPLGMGRALADTALNCSSCVHSHTAVRFGSGSSVGVFHEAERCAEEDAATVKRATRGDKSRQTVRGGARVDDFSGGRSDDTATRCGNRARYRRDSSSSHWSRSSADDAHMSVITRGQRSPRISLAASEMSGGDPANSRRGEIGVIRSEKDLLEILSLSEKQRRLRAERDRSQQGQVTGVAAGAAGETETAKELANDVAGPGGTPQSRSAGFLSNVESRTFASPRHCDQGEGFGSNESGRGHPEDLHAGYEEEKPIPILRLSSFLASDQISADEASQKAALPLGGDAEWEGEAQEQRVDNDAQSPAPPSPCLVCPPLVSDSSPSGGARTRGGEGDGGGAQAAGEGEANGQEEGRGKEDEADERVPQELSPSHKKQEPPPGVAGLAPRICGTRCNRMYDGELSSSNDQYARESSFQASSAACRRHPEAALSDIGGEKREMTDDSDAGSGRRKGKKAEEVFEEGNLSRERVSSPRSRYRETLGMRSCGGGRGQRHSGQKLCSFCAFGPHAELIEVGNADHRTICSSPAHQKKIFAALYDDDVVHVIC